MNSIIAIGAAHSFYLAFLIFTKGKKSISDIILILFLLSITGGFGLVWLSFEADIPFFLVFLWNYSLLLAPTFYLYAAALMSDKPHFKPSWLWHYIPYIASLFYLSYIIIILEEPEFDYLFANQNLFSGPPLFTFFSILELLIIPFYLVWIFILLKKHQTNISATFSQLEGRELKWLKTLSIGVLGFAVVVNGFAFLSTGENGLSDESSLQIGFALAVFFIFYMGYFGVKQTAVFSNIPVPIIDTPTETQKALEPSIKKAPTKKYEKSGLKDADLEAMAHKLLAFIENKQAYLQNDLTIHDLSNNLGISAHHLSQVLNIKLKKTFFELVNEYRVEAFKKRIAAGDNQQFTLLAIALGCGFNSKSSFNRVFKNMTGLTPGQYVKENR